MVGILVITHGEVAPALVSTAQVILGELDGISAVGLTPQMNREEAWKAVIRSHDAVDSDQGVLVLADAFGGTPSNLALALLQDREVEVLTGVNLPMVLRAARRRRDLELDALASDVLAYGRRNVSSASEWLTPDEAQE
ncbi:MAG: PTS fructose transporter subunit IIA [Myxococcota bacterium]|nr:PTS fructose transporter subunit IIA [Myxococcota bacterium]